MRHFDGGNPWNGFSGMGYGHECRRGYGRGDNYGYVPGYYDRPPLYPPYGYDSEYDRQMEKEFLQHRLLNIQEQERYIKERLEKLDELEKKENSKNRSQKN